MTRAPLILVVEDDEILSASIADNLQQEGWVCRIAANGVEALREVDAEEPDLVILDLLLPVMDGWQLCEHLRRTSHDFPIIICSALCGDADKVKALSLGADDYVCKPFSMIELMARVDASLRRSPGKGRHQHEAPMVSGPLEIFPARKEVRANGVQVELTSREFAVLCCLASHSPALASRDEIYRSVWGYEMLAGDRSVDVFVNRVRKKLAALVPEYEFIHTGHGQGYSFQARLRQSGHDSEAG